RRDRGGRGASRHRITSAGVSRCAVANRNEVVRRGLEYIRLRCSMSDSSRPPRPSVPRPEPRRTEPPPPLIQSKTTPGTPFKPSPAPSASQFPPAEQVTTPTKYR